MTSPRVATTNPALAAAQELADLKAGIPTHVHTSSSGVLWRCSSPYCDRGGDIRDEPQHGPNETASEAAVKYRRVYA